MNMDDMPKQKKLLIIYLLFAPLLISTFTLVYLHFSWQVEVAPGEMMSPIENRPLFVGLILFTVGYLFFLGMLFSDNIMQLFNKRFSLSRR